jgi:hypothetical protein
MSRLPDGMSFVIQSKNLNQQKWQTVDEFIPDAANGYMESNAYEDANAAFQLVFGNHNGGTTEYQLMKCIEQGYEVRPL